MGEGERERRGTAPARTPNGPRRYTRWYRGGTSPVQRAEATFLEQGIERALDLSVLDRLAQRPLNRLGVRLGVEEPSDRVNHPAVQVVGFLLDARFHAPPSSLPDTYNI